MFTVHWYRCGDRQVPKPLAVLLPWTFAQRQHVSKYTTLLNEQGWDVMVCTYPALAMWVEPWSSRNALTLVQHLDAELRQSGPRPVVFYVFSGAAKGCYAPLLSLLASPARCPAPVAAALGRVAACSAGAILDSSPVDFTSHMGQLLLAPQGSALPAQLGRAAAGVAAGVLDFWLLEVFEAGRDAMWSALGHPPTRGPLLFLYSRQDPLLDAARVQGLAAKLRANGRYVVEQVWDDSPHVGHLVTHPGAYKEAVTHLLGAALQEWSARQALRTCSAAQAQQQQQQAYEARVVDGSSGKEAPATTTSNSRGSNLFGGIHWAEVLQQPTSLEGASSSSQQQQATAAAAAAAAACEEQEGRCGVPGPGPAVLELQPVRGIHSLLPHHHMQQQHLQPQQQHLQGCAPDRPHPQGSNACSCMTATSSTSSSSSIGGVVLRRGECAGVAGCSSTCGSGSCSGGSTNTCCCSSASCGGGGGCSSTSGSAMSCCCSSSSKSSCSGDGGQGQVYGSRCSGGCCGSTTRCAAGGCTAAAAAAPWRASNTATPPLPPAAAAMAAGLSGGVGQAPHNSTRGASPPPSMPQACMALPVATGSFWHASAGDASSAAGAGLTPEAELLQYRDILVIGCASMLSPQQQRHPGVELGAPSATCCGCGNAGCGCAAACGAAGSSSSSRGSTSTGGAAPVSDPWVHTRPTAAAGAAAAAGVVPEGDAALTYTLKCMHRCVLLDQQQQQQQKQQQGAQPGTHPRPSGAARDPLSATAAAPGACSSSSSTGTAAAAVAAGGDGTAAGRRPAPSSRGSPRSVVAGGSTLRAEGTRSSNTSTTSASSGSSVVRQLGRGWARLRSRL